MNDNNKDIIRKKRSLVLKLATELGIKKPLDFIDFNRWINEKSVVKKDLNNCNLKELQLLIGQLYSWKSKTNK